MGGAIKCECIECIGFQTIKEDTAVGERFPFPRVPPMSVGVAHHLSAPLALESAQRWPLVPPFLVVPRESQFSGFLTPG